MHSQYEHFIMKLYPRTLKYMDTHKVMKWGPGEKGEMGSNKSRHLKIWGLLTALNGGETRNCETKCLFKEKTNRIKIFI